MDAKQLRNIAIVAHVDHGKTTLIDCLLKQTGTLDDRGDALERVMDSNDLERERGITILAKTTAIRYGDVQINIVDTPGHADFGGEVERILSMVDSVLLLVDAVEGPMPQTRFVTSKAFARGLEPIVVVNKIDSAGRASPPGRRRGIRPVRCAGRNGKRSSTSRWCTPPRSTGPPGSSLRRSRRAWQRCSTRSFRASARQKSMATDRCSCKSVLSITRATSGVIGIGRIARGRLASNTPVTVVGRDGSQRSARVLGVLGHHGLERVELPEAVAGDIVCVTGVDDVGISDTLCAPEAPQALPPLTVDEPTLSMTFCVNTSPFAGKEGDYLTSRQIKERLFREASHNVALRVEATPNPDQFVVSGRGELHLSVLIETMRREGYELAVSRPEVITREEDGVSLEPFEELSLDVEDEHQGKVMEALGERRADLEHMEVGGDGRTRLTYRIASRALMGFRPQFLSMTRGTGIMSYGPAGYGPAVGGNAGERSRGVLVSMAEGKAVGFALFNLQNRGRLFVAPGDPVYEGMVVGIHSRDSDLPVNPMKEKKLTNIRAAGSDENILLTPPTRLTLEQALEFINTDELVEVTPKAMRIRKRALKEHERRRAGRDR